jgi:hypothetical protein
MRESSMARLIMHTVNNAKTLSNPVPSRTGINDCRGYPLVKNDQKKEGL